MNKFKIGDRVRIKSNGDVGMVVDIFGLAYIVGVQKNGRHYTGCYDESKIELIDNSEILNN